MNHTKVYSRLVTTNSKKNAKKGRIAACAEVTDIRPCLSVQVIGAPKHLLESRVVSGNFATCLIADLWQVTHIITNLC
jgi:hypothetical protein